MPNLFKLIVLSFLTALTACSTTPSQHASAANIIDLSSTSLPGVAAEFITTREETHPEHDEHEHEEIANNVTWRFWRNTNQLTIERPQLGLGELWQRDGQSVIHRKLYHNDQRAIEFQPDDLRMLGTAPSWQKLSLLLDQNVLAQLQAGEIEWSDGYPVREYLGKVADSEWHIVMRMDLALPVLIERKHEHGSERTELVHAYALPEAPWQPTPANNYDVIDFADLGDKEYDPFVVKVQAQMGHSHQH
ncbi:MAG: hypothetical protein HOO92_06640 [Methylococcaceae bacterium]|nr:hypothetical protein [Methylococcaceae bacterium]